MKWCGACEEVHDRSMFYTDSKGHSSAYCKEQTKKKAKARYTSDPSVQKERNRQRQVTDPEALRLLHRTVYAPHHRLYNAKRRGLEDTGDVIDRRAIWGRDEGCCRIKLLCNVDFVPFEEMHLDHVVPLAAGGTHTWNNVQTSCAACNLAKGSKLQEVVF
jgi:hypothetical protein